MLLPDLYDSLNESDSKMQTACTNKQSFQQALIIYCKFPQYVAQGASELNMAIIVYSAMLRA